MSDCHICKGEYKPTCSRCQPKKDGGKNLENAMLIAASPELLTALKELLAQSVMSENAFSPAVVKAKQIIAKAEGRE